MNDFPSKYEKWDENIELSEITEAIGGFLDQKYSEKANPIKNCDSYGTHSLTSFATHR